MTNQWDFIIFDSKYRNIKKSKSKRKYTGNTPRGKQIIINRARIGHYNVIVYMHLI